MKVLGPTRNDRLNEAGAVVLLFVAAFLTLSLVSYSPEDASWNTAAGPARPQNLFGYPGSHVADLLFQSLGIASFALPVLVLLVAWRWIRSQPIDGATVKVFGAAVFVVGSCTALALGPDWKPLGATVPLGGLIGTVVAAYLIETLNMTGALLATLTALLLSLYLISRFSMSMLRAWFAGPIRLWTALAGRWRGWREEQRRREAERLQELRKRRRIQPEPPRQPEPEPVAIPIHTLEEHVPMPEPPAFEVVPQPPPEVPAPKPAANGRAHRRPQATPTFQLPATDLLNEPSARSAYDSQELQDLAARIKSKFEEFGVLGSVVQINPGPVVTTFEFKPEAGIKYTRMTTLTEDLCLGLQAESILIERIPGKPTVGIEVPNKNRELISLRQVLESDEFLSSTSRLTIPLGKDISGRIRVTALEAMPHLLIAGSTGSGKSVMLNSLIMSILSKATPNEVRLILVDPKRVELGIYEGIPHLLTPVITDPKKATNALRNAVLEMERRLKLLAAQGVRNLEQYNRKIERLSLEPRPLFPDQEAEEEELRPLPFILILIDELSDLMMVERANVEESVTRLAQMARAVGMHLVVATQRPSVDVVTGLIKANFPARISFRVATRVDSRTVLDQMGSEHLLGKGDMLFLPPGSGRLTRVHGALVTEAEINRVVEFWKQQALPEYDQTFLIAPPSDDDDSTEEFEGGEDPLYPDAVRVVCEMGKASTSTLQRRLRLGYGRAARILDMMQRDGIIGPPDGSRPRDVLKRPDWLDQVEAFR